ncbi:MAG TPA: NapC/NirT family cytochrome c [Rhodoblastus sp.]|nr:NapC/NirT family cytochrome c [Rhodoblastus sp.]
MQFRTFLKWLSAPALLVGLVAGVLVWGGFNTAMEATNTLDFCISCHEMRDNPYAEYKKSVHYRNASGVRAICSDCHVPKDWTHKVVRKAQASMELLAKLRGAIDTPEKYEARRVDLARHEWARMKATDSRECRNCHSFEAMDHAKQSQRAAAAMEKAAQQNWTCIDCHKGVAHKLPDLSRERRRMLEALERAAADAPPKAGDVVVALKATPFRLAAPGDDESNDGEIAAGAELRVIEARDEWLKAELSGWRREGSDETLFAAIGKRIVQASLSPRAAEQMTKLRAQSDPATDMQWREGKLEIWTQRAAVSSDRAALSAYSGELYSSACNFCHDLPPTTKHDANDWIGTMNAMKRMTPLSDGEAQFLLRYLQMHASDAR